MVSVRDEEMTWNDAIIPRDDDPSSPAIFRPTPSTAPRVPDVAVTTVAHPHFDLGSEADPEIHGTPNESRFLLQGIRIENFKSYQGVFEISPFPTGEISHPLICVVGPNGSGKSNLMDAIAFCFNCADSTKLRGDGNVANLISNCGPEDDDRPTSGSVTVTLVPRHPTGQEGGEVVFSRIVSSRNESKYRLNGKLVTLETYRESMKVCGLDFKGNFLVFQGDVEALALSDSAELGEIVDRVSGSGEFKKECEALRKEKFELETEYAKLAGRKKKLLADKKRVKADLSEIEKIDGLIFKKSKINNEFFLSKLWLLDEEIRACEKNRESEGGDGNEPDYDELVKELAVLESGLGKIKSDRAKLDVKNAKLSRKIVTGEDDLKKAVSAVADASARVDTCERKIDGVAKQVHSTKERAGGLKSTIVIVEDRIRENEILLKKERDALDQLLNQGVVDIDSQRDKDTVVPSVISHGCLLPEDELKRKLRNFRTIQVPIKTADCTSDLASIDREITGIQTSTTSLSIRRSELSQQLVKNESDEKSTAGKISDLEKQIEVKGKELRKLKKEMGSSRVVSLSERIARLEGEKKRLLDDLNEIRDSEAEVARERNLRDTVSQMTAQFGNELVFGRLVDLVEPVEARLGLAVQTAVGKYMDSVLVKNVGTANSCVAWLRETRKGSITFVPVDDVRLRPSTQHTVGVSAVDCIKIRSENLAVKRGIEFVLGGTFVCESMALARDLAYRTGAKVVTVGGEKISPNGNITVGGSLRGTSRFDLRQVGEISKKLDEAEKEIAALMVELRAQEDKSNQHASEHRAKEVEISSLTADAERMRSEFNRLHESVRTIAKYLDDNRAEAVKLEQRLTDTQIVRTNKLGEISLELQKLAKQFLVHSLSIPEGVSVPADVLLAVAGSLNDPSTSNRAVFDQSKKLQKETVARLEISIESLKSEVKCLELELGELDDVSALQQEEVALRRALTTAERERSKAENELTKMEANLATLRDEVQSTVVQKSECEASIKSAISSIQTLRDQMRIAKEDSESKRKRIDRIKKSKIQVLRDSVLSNVFVPLVLTGEDLTSGPESEVSRQIIESVFVSLTAVVPVSESGPSDGDSVESLIDEVLAKVNYESVPADVKRKGSGMVKKNRLSIYLADLENQRRDALREIETEMEQSGGLARSGTEDAGAALAGIEKELKSVATEAESVKTELQGVSDNFKRVKRQRNILFLNCFKFISKTVDELYKLLSSYEETGADASSSTALVPVDVSSTASASLDLETPVSDLSSSEVFNSGIIFSLMPPYKRYTTIELLSGGEKTVAAVALLFSLLSYSGPPFSMVDEIDAALDAGNVAVLARFMKQAVPHQLIVISLKEKMYAKADCLVGVYKDPATQGSGLVALDLRPYPEHLDDGEVEAVAGENNHKAISEGPQMTPGPVTSRREGRVIAGGA